MEIQEQQQSPTLEDCLKLLKGERDEQRLAGLLLVTKFCKGDDIHSLHRVYDAVGIHFLDRLLRTGLGTGAGTSSGGDNRDAYLQLSVTVLAAFCRVPEIASSKEMVSKIPLVLEIASKGPGSLILEECYEFLYLVLTASEGGVALLIDSGGMKVLALHMSSLADGSHVMELAMKIVQLLLGKLVLEKMNTDHQVELSMMVVAIVKQFAVLHNALKFEALHILSAVFSSDYAVVLHEALRNMPDKNWSNYMRAGIVAILQNRVAPAEKFHALIVADSTISVVGEQWLIGPVCLSTNEDPIPPHRCLLLVLESSKVEVAVLLNDLAYLKYEAPKDSSTADSILLKQQNLAVAFSLLEKIIKLISESEGNEGVIMEESLILKVIKSLDETLGMVLEYIKDAKEHGQNKGDDLLASVRLAGSYLAEAPVACNDKIPELLDYMLSVEGEDESSSFYSVCFLLPMLCQLTMTTTGCKLLTYSGGCKVVGCLIKLISKPVRQIAEDTSRIFLACDTILNLLLKREQVNHPVDESIFVDLLKGLTHWPESTNDPSSIMMAATICTLILDMTSEDALLNHLNFDTHALGGLSQLIARSFSSWGQGLSKSSETDMDLLEIINTGYARWAHRFPRVREIVGAVDR